MTEKSRSKIATAATAITTGITVYNLAKDWKTSWDNKKLYTATVPEGAYVYRPLMVWINNQVNSRNIKFESRFHGVKRFYDGSHSVNVSIDGMTLEVSIQKPDILSKSSNSLASYDSVSSMFENNVVFTATTPEAIDALENLLVVLTEQEKASQRETYIYNPGQYGWDATNFTYRDIDSVFLPEGVKEKFLEDVDTFLGNEARYQIMGVPWHRGYLLYGSPGNGKSSLVASIAHKYHFSLYNLPLSGVKDDKQLAELISRISENAILLLEDIDIFSKSMKREQADSGPTLAGLLNALDGVNTPHGLLTFITTNCEDTLDAALTRPGRVDLSLELKAPVQYQIDTAFARIYDEPLGVEAKEFDSMAELVNVFKMNPNDSEAARLAIKK